MVKKIFSLLDVKVQEFQQPFICGSEVVAVRELQQAVKADNMISKYPEDFQLFHIANFDDVQGTYENVSPPKFIVGAVSLVEKKEGKDGKAA